MAWDLTDTWQACVALTKRGGPCELRARVDLRQQLGELFLKSPRLCGQLGVAPGLVGEFFIFAAAYDASVDSCADIEVGVFRFPR